MPFSNCNSVAGLCEAGSSTSAGLTEASYSNANHCLKGNFPYDFLSQMNRSGGW